MAVLSPLWGSLLAGSPFDVMKKHVADIVAEGYDMSELLCNVHDLTIKETSFSDLDKGLICEKIAQVGIYSLLEGGGRGGEGHWCE